MHQWTLIGFFLSVGDEVSSLMTVLLSALNLVRSHLTSITATRDDLMP